MNFNEEPTYHKMDPKILAPKRLPKIGDTVLIKTIGMPQVKLIVDRTRNLEETEKDFSKVFGGPICGKASFYDPVDNTAPFADQNTSRGGLAPA